MLAANHAVKTPDTFPNARYRRLLRRGKGKKEAYVAIAHTITTAIWHMLKTGEPYTDLGTTHYDKIGRGRRIAQLEAEVARLKAEDQQHSAT